MSNDLLKRLGNYLKKKAKPKFKTNVDFAIACDVDEKTIRRIMNGEQNISINVLKRICDALDIKMSDLIKEIEK